MSPGRPWLQTFSGRRYNLDRPNPSSIRVQDVAHSLSLINRYTGHTRFPFSVAQHSFLGARWALDNCPGWPFSSGFDFAREFLLHDAHECVTGDVASPIKRVLGIGWRAFEHRHERAFRRRFGLRLRMPREVKRLDLAMLATERPALLREPADVWVQIEGVEPLPIPIKRWSPEEAESRFLDLARILEVT